MLPIHSSDQHCHASNSGPVLTSTDMQTPAADASTTSTTLSAQDNAALKIPATTQEGTNESTSVPSSEQHNDGVDEAMEELYLAEPDQWAFQPIFTGRLIWLAKHSDKPIVPFEELPLPRSDQARVPPCTVCWQFIRNFNLNCKEDIARGSLHLQACQQMQAKGITTPNCVVNFPHGTGHSWRLQCLVTTWLLSMRSPWSSIRPVFNMSLLGQLSLTIPLLSRYSMFLKQMCQPPPLAMWLNLSRPTPKSMMFGFDRSLTMMTPLLWPILMYTLPSSPLKQEMKEALTQFGSMLFLVMYKSSPMTASSAMLDIYNGAHLARAERNTSTLSKTVPVASATSVYVLGTLLLSAPIPHMMMAIQLLSLSKWRKVLVVPMPSTMAPNHILLSSSLFIATWNCAMLNDPSCFAALHNPSTPLGKAEIVFLQEMRLASPQCQRSRA